MANSKKAFRAAYLGGTALSLIASGQMTAVYAQSATTTVTATETVTPLPDAQPKAHLRRLRSKFAQILRLQRLRVTMPASP